MNPVFPQRHSAVSELKNYESANSLVSKLPQVRMRKSISYYDKLNAKTIQKLPSEQLMPELLSQ